MEKHLFRTFLAVTRGVTLHLKLLSLYLLPKCKVNLSPFKSVMEIKAFIEEAEKLHCRIHFAE